ncbi:MAG: nuclear transport factor 2 family protein [Kiritimatiellae bacterium]|nr:nuclear transport factor 2 family protein [Kiritimatiellia bacterium]
MNRRWIWIGLAIAAGALVWIVTHPGDEARMRRAVRKLAQSAEKKNPESPITAATRADGIASLFARDDVHVHVEGAPSFMGSRDELRSLIFQVRDQAEYLVLTIHDVRTEVAPDRASAVQQFSAEISARIHGGEDHALREVRMDWVNEEDQWRIRRIEADEGLKRIP